MKYVCISCWTSKSAENIARSFRTVYVRRSTENIPTGICTACLANASNHQEQHTHIDTKVAV